MVALAGTTFERVRQISGQCRDAGVPGDRVVATVFAPAPVPPPIPPIGLPARVHCPFLFDADKYIFGEDQAQCVELAVGLVCSLFVHRGVRGIVVSLTPPDGPLGTEPADPMGTW